VATLLLIDLDNTLIDRTGSFKRWAVSRFGPAELDWLVEADKDGYEKRERLAAMIAARYDLEPGTVLPELRAGMIENLTLEPAVPAALASAVDAGFVPVVVTNGTVAQQEAKLRRTGLDALVAGWTISEGAGVRKPDRRIFELAAASVGHSLESGGWMIGDHAEYDVGGGTAAGLQTAWLAYGRPWPEALTYAPTVTGADFPGAISELVRCRSR
jgi:putative hydrolase of the HAD superfamily